LPVLQARREIRSSICAGEVDLEDDRVKLENPGRFGRVVREMLVLAWWAR